MRTVNRHRRVQGLRVVIAAAVAALSFRPTTLGAQGLGLELGETSLRVDQTEPGAQVVLVSVERRPADFASRLETLVRSSADSDGDGSVEFELDAPPGEASIWLAIDAASGRFGMTSPIDGAPFAFPEPLGLAPPRNSGPSVVGADGHSALRILLVRPGSGAWQLTAVDGGETESTGVADGRVALYAPDWEPVVGIPGAPGQLRPTDIVFAVDSDALAVDAQLFGGLNVLP